MQLQRSFGHVARIVVIPAVSAALAACSPGSAARGTWVAERKERGDTLIVRTISGSVWGQPMALAEEMRIGALEGPEEITFGSVQSIAVDSGGGIFVFDR